MVATGATALSIKLKFPEFQTLDDATVTFALEEAYLVVDQSTSLKARDICAMYLAAHILAVAQATSGSDGREVISETIGRISVTYKGGASSKDGPFPGDLQTTAYGARYIQLKNLGNPKFLMVGGDTQPFKRNVWGGC